MRQDPFPDANKVQETVFVRGGYKAVQLWQAKKKKLPRMQKINNATNEEESQKPFSGHAR